MQNDNMGGDAVIMPPLCRISISERIKQYREEKSISQSEFGRLMGVSAQAVYKWERGICYPDITVLPYLAKIVGCSVDDFFEQ